HPVTKCPTCYRFQNFKNKVDKFYASEKENRKQIAANIYERNKKIKEISENEILITKNQRAIADKPVRHEGSAGYVYLLQNPIFDGWIKVGFALNLEDRLSTYQTSDPNRGFQLIEYKLVEDCRYIEQQIKIVFLEHSIFSLNEWFIISIDKAIKLFYATLSMEKTP